MIFKYKKLLGLICSKKCTFDVIFTLKRKNLLKKVKTTQDQLENNIVEVSFVQHCVLYTHIPNKILFHVYLNLSSMNIYFIFYCVISRAQADISQIY